MYILPRIKKAAAICLAVLIAAAVLGTSNGENLVTTSAAPESTDYQQRLKEIEEEQSELDKKIAAADESINGEKQKLDAVNQKIENVKEKIAAVEEHTKEIEDEMVALDEEMRETQYALSSQEEAIKSGVNDFMERVRIMYIAGTDTYTDVLVNSSDFYDVLMRLELVKRVAGHDNDVISSLMAQKDEIEKTKSLLEEQSEKLKAKSKEYSEQQKSLSEEQAELLKLQLEYDEKISQLESEKSGYENESDKLSDEYGKVSGNAAKTSTSAGTKTDGAASTKKTTAATDSGSETEKSTTTKKTTVTTASEDSGEPEDTTTTKKQTTTAKPVTTTQEKPVTTTTTGSSGGGDSSYDQTKIDIVVSYAKSMVGGRYVFGGSSFGATDCSGLVMLSYAQIGISLPHKASSQAGYGTSVSYDNMKPGDLIFFGGSSYSSIYHVAMYIGDGRMVHAENENTGIVISNVASFSKYNNITCIKRLI